MSKLWAAYLYSDDISITRSNPDWLYLSLRSVINTVDKVIIINGNQDGPSKAFTETIKKFASEKIDVIWKTYPLTDTHRNEYLKYIPKDDWVLVINADEILGDDGNVLKDVMTEGPGECYNLGMHCYIYNLNSEDAKKQNYFENTRFFKNKVGIKYTNSILEGFRKYYSLNQPKLFNYNLAKDMLNFNVKMKEAMEKTQDKASIRLLKHSIFFGTYPTIQSTVQHPKVIREWFLD